MSRFLVWFARYWLRPTQSPLWGVCLAFWMLSFTKIGVWAFLWLFVSAIVVSVIEVLWNDVYDAENAK